MQTRRSPIVDQVIDRYFMSSEMVKEVKDLVYGLGVEQGVEKIAAVLILNPESRGNDVERVKGLDAKGFGFDIAQTFLDRINRISDPNLRINASKKLGEIIQYSSLDIWETVKAHKPDFIENLLVGFKRCNAKSRGHSKLFFDSMAVGYLYGLGKEHEKSSKGKKSAGPPSLPTSPDLPPPLPAPVDLIIEEDTRRIEFNPRSDFSRRKTRLYTLFKDYGYVYDIREIKGFFEEEYQFGRRVRCPGTKRNHIALLFDTLLKEEILILTGGKGHWKVLENCFVDEWRKSLSKSFSKLLSKLRKEEVEKAVIFEEIDEIMKDLKK